MIEIVIFLVWRCSCLCKSLKEQAGINVLGEGEFRVPLHSPHEPLARIIYCLLPAVHFLKLDGDVLPQTPSFCHVEKLNAPADAEDRDILCITLG